MTNYIKKYADIITAPKLKILHYDFTNPNGIVLQNGTNKVLKVVDLTGLNNINQTVYNIILDEKEIDGKKYQMGRFAQSRIEIPNTVLPKRYYLKIDMVINSKYDSYFFTTSHGGDNGMMMWYNSYYGEEIGIRELIQGGFPHNWTVRIAPPNNKMTTVELIHNGVKGEVIILRANGGEYVGRVTNADIIHTTNLSIGGTVDGRLFLDGWIKSVEIYDLDKFSLSLIKARDGRYYTFIGDQLTIVPESETSEDKLLETIKTKGFAGSTPERMQAIQKDLPYSEFSLVTLEL